MAAKVNLPRPLAEPIFICLIKAVEVFLQNLLRLTMLSGGNSFFQGSVAAPGNFVCAGGFGGNAKIRFLILLRGCKPAQQCFCVLESIALLLYNRSFYLSCLEDWLAEGRSFEAPWPQQPQEFRSCKRSTIPRMLLISKMPHIQEVERPWKIQNVDFGRRGRVEILLGLPEVYEIPGLLLAIR